MKSQWDGAQYFSIGARSGRLKTKLPLVNWMLRPKKAGLSMTGFYFVILNPPKADEGSTTLEYLLKYL
jgi:hypothetical protein